MKQTADNPLPPPVTPKGEATRRNLLFAAEAEIGEKGFHGASVSVITTRAGVGQGTFYLYFRSKDEVLRELVGHMGVELRESLAGATEEATDQLDEVRQRLRAFLAFLRQRPNLYRVMMESQFVDQEVYQGYYQALADTYQELIDSTKKQGEVRPGDSEVQAWATMGIGHFLGLQYAIWQNCDPPEEVIETAVNFAARGMGLEEI